MPLTIVENLCEEGMDLKKQYKDTRSNTEEICKYLATEDTVVQPVAYVSPPKWHLGHTTWFFETFILSKFEDYKPFDDEFSFLFNSYYNHVGDRVLRAHRGNLSRPLLVEVYAYRAYVDEYITGKWSNGLFNKEIEKLIEVGIHHEKQHQELLWYDLKFILGHNPLFPAYKKEFEFDLQVKDKGEFLDISKGNYYIGHNNSSFCYDNEQGYHEVLVQPFSISTSLVSIGDYLEFMEDGGYEKFEYWLSDGWDWVQGNDVKAPLYWYKQKEEWLMYKLSGLSRLDKNAILTHISFYEADAYARWKGMRLPTEFEWEVASKKINYGQVWEWTQSAYLPYPNFKIAEGALGEYNGKFMVNQKVLRGGAVTTPNNHIRPTYRNFFQPELRWMYAGIRLVK